MNAYSQPSTSIDSQLESKPVQVLIEKNKHMCICGHMQFKSLLFTGQLYTYRFVYNNIYKYMYPIGSFLWRTLLQHATTFVTFLFLQIPITKA